MSWSWVQIANMAISKAGMGQEIQSLEASPGERVPTEQLKAMLYRELAFEAVARSFNWLCLTRAATLTAVTTITPGYGYDYVMSLPADYLGWLSVLDLSAKYKKMGRQLHSDMSPLHVEYVAKTEDTTRFDALFVEALVMRWAAHLAPVTGEDGVRIAQMFLEWHERVDLPNAEYADAVEQSPDEMDSSRFLDARRR